MIYFLLGIMIGASFSLLLIKYKIFDSIPKSDKNFKNIFNKQKKLKPRINDDKAAWMVENGRET